MASPSSVSSVPLVILNAGALPVRVIDIAPVVPNEMLRVRYYQRDSIVPPGVVCWIRTSGLYYTHPFYLLLECPNCGTRILWQEPDIIDNQWEGIAS